MILLFNLNKYVGGGEVLLIRFAKYLKSISSPYCILSFEQDCYIAKEARVHGLELFAWPVVEDSIAYMLASDQNQLLQAIQEKFGTYDQLNCFTFCFRDIYNSIFLFSQIAGPRVFLSHGIYHPEDVHYLSRLSLNKGKILDFNRQVLLSLCQEGGVIFVNESGRKISLGDKSDNQGTIIPIPIPVPQTIPEKSLEKTLGEKKEPIRLVCISRFVEFKIAAVLAILRFVQKNPNYHLDLIGYGPWKFLLDFYITRFKMTNVTLHGKLAPEQLDQVIDNAHIGFAQGTSILEIAKRGLPVIIAPYSNLLDIFDSNFLCMGVFGERKDFNFGDYRSNGGKESVAIAETVYKVVNNFAHYRKLSLDHLQLFSDSILFRQMEQVVLSSKFNQFQQFKNLPRGSKLKFWIRKIL